eukprot:Amastigsp_a508465_296.p3 type:complete len:127 gc:universal Amastigsp_a508465_296:345-725(+)
MTRAREGSQVAPGKKLKKVRTLLGLLMPERTRPEAAVAPAQKPAMRIAQDDGPGCVSARESMSAALAATIVEKKGTGTVSGSAGESGASAASRAGRTKTVVRYALVKNVPTAANDRLESRLRPLTP